VNHLKTIKKLKDADALYYSTGEAIFTDEEYDDLKDPLYDVPVEDPAYPEIQKYLIQVGAEVVSEWEKATHKIKMDSQRKVKNWAEFKVWYEKLPSKLSVILERKIDGLSLDVEYEAGKPVKAITRGDGCLSYYVKVEFNDGKILPIGEVVENEIKGKIKCFNTSTGKVEYKEITNFFSHEKELQWYEIDVEYRGAIITLEVTENQYIWLPKQNCYRRVLDLNEADWIYLES